MFADYFSKAKTFSYLDPTFHLSNTYVALFSAKANDCIYKTHYRPRATKTYRTVFYSLSLEQFIAAVLQNLTRLPRSRRLHTYISKMYVESKRQELIGSDILANWMSEMKRNLFLQSTWYSHLSIPDLCHWSSCEHVGFSSPYNYQCTCRLSKHL
jgi:hypothetical protein